MLPERMKIEKVGQVVANLHDKTEYLIHIINLKPTLNDGLVLKKDIIIKFNQQAWIKSYIEMKTDLRKKSRSEKVKLVNNAAFKKKQENVRKSRDIKLLTIEKRNYLVAEESSYTSFFLFCFFVVFFWILKLC